MSSSITLHNRRKQRNRKALKIKSNGKLRLSVFRSNKHIYGQIIDDVNGNTVISASSLDSNLKNQFKNCGTKEVASVVGKLIAEKISGSPERFNFLADINNISILGGDILRRPIYTSAIAYYKFKDTINSIF